MAVFTRSPSGISTVSPSSGKVSGGISEKVYTFVQRVGGDNMTLVSTALTSIQGVAKYMVQSSAAEVDYAFAFCLNDLGQQATFTGLFDEYRFDKVVLNFRPLKTEQVNAATPLTAAFNTFADSYDSGTMIVAIDQDDYANATFGALQQYSSSLVCRVIQPNDIKVVINRPKVSQALYAGAFTSYGSSRTWIDCASISVQHFGCKVAIERGIANLGQLWAVDAEYTVSFRGVR